MNTMDNYDIYKLAKLDLIEAIKDFRNSMHHTNHTDKDVAYELYDAILEATDGAINPSYGDWMIP